jgi:predicted dehydrogenase
MKKVSLAILGCGARGAGVYAKLVKEVFSSEAEVVALADPDPERLSLTERLCGVDPSLCFSSGDELLKKGKIADALIIATMDRDHVGYAIKALELGYDILLEKPISPLLEDCLALKKAYLLRPHNVVVCHVLRYNSFYGTLKEVIDSGSLGTVINAEASENVGYWHMAHSFVRGNWRNAETSSPMILQKSCHDMDLFVWLFGSRCESLSSLGSLREFKKENAPKGSTDRCLTCPLKDCIFDARKIYLTNKKTGFCQGNRSWPIVPYLTPVCTKERILEALEKGPYGRCVYHCDNDVVDHETTLLAMENGVVVSFTMSAFSAHPHRMIKVMGTLGEIQGDDEENYFVYRNFKSGEEKRIDCAPEAHLQGHGGGDNGLLADFLALEEGKPTPKKLTSLPVSLESHFMCFAAEKSRLQNGTRIVMKDIRD